MSALNIRSSMVNTLDHLFAAKKFDLTVSLANMYPLEKIERAISNTPGVTGAEGWFATEGSLPHQGQAQAQTDLHSVTNSGGPHGAGSGIERFTAIALPPDTKLLEFDIIAGRKLAPSDTDAIVINNALAAKLPQAKVGDTISLRMGPADTSWRLVGITREAFSPSVAYLPQSFIQQKHPGMVNSLRLALAKADPDSINSMKTSLDRNLEEEGVRARGSMSKADSRFSFDQHMLMIYVFLVVMSSIVAGVGGLGLMTTMSLNVLERRREMGVLRAIGATSSVVWLIVVLEGLIIGLLSWMLAALVAWPFSEALGNLLVGLLFKSGLNFTFEPVGLLIWLVVSIALSAGASFFPAWRASRSTVREALAYE